MQKLLLIMLLFATGCKGKPSHQVISDTSKLLLSEEITFNDTTDKKDTAWIIRYTYDTNNNLIRTTIDSRPFGRSFDSHKYIYDNNNNLIQQKDSVDGKVSVIEYHYINGIPAYSTHPGSDQHIAEYTIKENKLIKIVTLQDSTVISMTYEGNKCIKGIMYSEKIQKILITNLYKYGTKRSPYYDRRWGYFQGSSSDNELLQTTSMGANNLVRIDDCSYTYNSNGYPIKDIDFLRDAAGILLNTPMMTYYKYIPANPQNKKDR
jgi:YD repeat-containing protein